MYVLVVTVLLNLGFINGHFIGQSEDSYGTLQECRSDAWKKDMELSNAQGPKILDKKFECVKVEVKPEI